MREAARRWGGRLLFVLPVLLAICCLGLSADSLWFRAHVPMGFQNANWTGGWQSGQYVGVSGRLLVRLPDPLPENRDFKAEALVYYPVFSLWKSGQFVKMDFTGNFSPNAPASAGRNTNALPDGGGMMKFKAMAAGQIVEYVALLDPTRARIVGGYLSHSPGDCGLFEIKYY